MIERTRLAPTPSGYLHLGNAVNLALVALLARAQDGIVALRIDDMDAPRYRADYVDDIFDALAWLGVPWHEGPRDRPDLEENHSLRHRTDLYRHRLEEMIARGLPAYACRCSRQDLRQAGSLSCVSDCRSGDVPFVAGSTALRVRIPADTQVTVAGRTFGLLDEFGDVVVWRRDDLPAYHLASLHEDLSMAITDVIRGEDLWPSSALQAWLARFATPAGLDRARFWHHPLVTAPDGMKLSKSQLAQGPLPRTESLREQVWALAEGYRSRLAPGHVTSVT